MPKQHQVDAYKILSTATPATHRPLLAWAAGAISCGHAIKPLNYWHTRDIRKIAPEYNGQSLDRGRMLRCTRSRIEITDGNLRQPLRIAWADIATLLDAGMTDPLIRRCQEAVNAWRDHPGGFRGAGWSDVVDACCEAGAAVWIACRPADPGEQLDLFAAADLGQP